MPQIIRQTAKPIAVKRPVAPASILSQAIPVVDLLESYIKMVIYGTNRVGKTTLACGMIDEKTGKEIPGSGFPKPLLLIAFEPNMTGGAQSVKRINGVTYIKITHSHDAINLANELSKSNLSNWKMENGVLVRIKDSLGRPVYTGLPFVTHVLDTATSYQDLILQEILNLPAVPEQLNWGMVSTDDYRQRSEKTKEALRPFLNLPVHTVILAKEKDHKPQEERNKLLRSVQLESFFASDLGAATVSWLHDACDYIARLFLAKETVMKQYKNVVGTGANKKETITSREEETGKIIRRLRTMYHPNYAAGFRSCNPSKVPEHIDAPTFDKIHKIIKGE